MPDGKIESFKLIVSGGFAWLVTALGADYKYVSVLILLMVADTLLGWLKSFKTRSFKSAKAKWGFSSKIIELGLVYILGRLDWAFGTSGWLGNTGVIYYGIVEMASMVENIHDGGLATLPEGLVELLRKLKFNTGKLLLAKCKQAAASLLGVNADTLNVNDDEKKE